MKKQGYPELCIKIIKEYYQNSTAYINTDVKGRKFQTSRGVKQGDPLSLILFNIVIEEIFRHLQWEDRGVNINGIRLNNLHFADDVVLIANFKQELEYMINELNDEGKKLSLIHISEPTRPY